jgi:hypothetical protein
VHVDQDPPDSEECEADDYFEKYFLDPPQELREDEASLPDKAVLFGDEATVGTFVAIETAVHLARQRKWLNERDLSDTEWPRLCWCCSLLAKLIFSGVSGEWNLDADGHVVARDIWEITVRGHVLHFVENWGKLLSNFL